MRIITPTILAFFLTLPSPLARASTCTDWSQSRSLPQFEPGILGDLCQVKDNTAFVADSELKIIDLSDPEFARIAGTLPLPGTATDLQVRGDFAYLIVDGFPLVEVDVSTPSSPLITRSFPETGTFSDVVALDPYMAVLDDQSRLHIFDVTQGNPLTRIAIHPLPLSAVTDIGCIESFLVIRDARNIVVMDYSDPLVLEETSRIDRYGQFSGFGPDYMIFGYYENETRESVLHKITVDETGQAHLDFFRYLRGVCLGLLAVQDLVCIHLDSGNYQFLLFDVGGGPFIASYEAPGETAMGLSPTRLASISPITGFQWIDISELGVVPSLNTFGLLPQGSNCIYEMTGYSCWSTSGWLSNQYWIEQTYSWSDYTGGGFSSGFKTNIFDLHDPSNPIQIFHSDGPGSAGNWDGQWMVSNQDWCDDAENCTFCTHTFELIDLRTMTPVQYWNRSSLEGLGREGMLWLNEFASSSCSSPFELKGYKVDEIGNVSERVNLGARSGYRSNFGNVVILAEGGSWNAYDFSDSSNVQLVSSVPMGISPSLCWEGPTVYYASPSLEISSIDYSDPANPQVQNLITATKAVGGLRADEDFLLLRYQDGDLQLAGDLPTGGMTMVSPIISGGFVSADIIGNQLYANSPSGLRLYDITDPAQPVYVGQAAGDLTRIGEINGYLVGGSKIYEFDCGLVRNLALSLAPEVGPIEIPAEGGSFTYSVELTAPEQVIVDAVIDAVLPDGSTRTMRTPGPFNLTEGTHTWSGLRQDVPTNAPAGIYTYRCTATAVDGRTATAHFTLAKLPGTAVSNYVPDWNLTGWEGEASDRPSPSTGFVLQGAAPNPFNPSTTISFDLTGPGRTDLRVYDISGKLQRTLIAGEPFHAGHHEIPWDGRDDRGKVAAAGVYFFRLESGNRVETGRMVMVK